MGSILPQISRGDLSLWGREVNEGAQAGVQGAMAVLHRGQGCLSSVLPNFLGPDGNELTDAWVLTTIVHGSRLQVPTAPLPLFRAPNNYNHY